MEVAWFSIPKEGVAKSQQDQDHVNCCFFFYWEGVVHHNYSPPGQTINEYYLNVLHRLRYAIQQKWPQLWATADWQLHHDNMPVPALCFMRSFFEKHITKVTQPPYSTDLVPCDFWLFPKLKSPLTGRRFQTVDEVQENIMGQLVVIPTKDFAKCFEQWKRCWENHVRYQGAYFEGDWSVIVLCTMFLVCCIFFNKCLYLSYYMAEYFLYRSCACAYSHKWT